MSKIQCADKVECISVKGNFMDKHPDAKALIIQYFHNLKEIDSVKVTEGVKAQIRDAQTLRKKFIPTLYKLDQKTQTLQLKLEDFNLTLAER